MAKGFLLVISGPSGCGKGTVCKQLFSRNDDLVFSVSATTRDPRQGEVDGREYFFLDREDYEAMIDKGEFLEYANVHNNFYGTPKKFVLDQVEKGNIVVLEIDVQGALQVRENYPEATFIFLLPPSMEELEDRITKRGTETKEVIKLRMDNARDEIKLLGKYDYLVFNDNLDTAVDEVEAIIKSEKLKVKRYDDILEDFLS